ncbi:helix-turn-helix transcriptional regulator [Pseudomonas typographi]|uniref:helix-turn-helix transcriptional regulator n=1 Tax=Pseudomonas typographi TaxID=2715964 RepID=UPI0016826773|nr:helix-turn-helix transcriptional regulator [Pseudomonas typographi]MBD1589632.1 helix-turn-helix transcriptional regulator [Pseudomonas typographi]
MNALTYGNWKAFTNKGLAVMELMALMGKASGKTAKQVARDLDRSHHTIVQRMKSVRFKLKAVSESAAVAEAMRLGIIAFGSVEPPEQERPQKDRNAHSGVFIA